jgi:hypothetical protein
MTVTVTMIATKCQYSATLWISMSYFAVMRAGCATRQTVELHDCPKRGVQPGPDDQQPDCSPVNVLRGIHSREDRTGCQSAASCNRQHCGREQSGVESAGSVVLIPGPGHKG